jgi:tripartite-type tricarboxylate transporter receptor subunit TctC
VTYGRPVAACALIVAAALFPILQGQAQTWPTRPVTLVVSFAPGGGTDAIARIFAPGLAKALGQEVVISNVPGAGAMLGTAQVAKAPPDGNQVSFAGSNDVINQSLFKRPLYDFKTDVTPVLLIADQPAVLLARKDIPAANLQEFIRYAKENKLNYGAATGSTSHLDCIQFHSEVGITAIHVPYRGGAAAMPDLMAGRLDYVCTLIGTALSQIESGAVKPLAILTLKRSPIFPALPTADEQGVAKFEATPTWQGLVVARGTPPAIVERLRAASIETIEDKAVQQRLMQIGAAVVPPEHRSTAYFERFIEAEIDKKAAIIKGAGLGDN